MLIFSSFFFWGGASKLLLRMMQRAQGHLLHAVPLLFLMSGLFALDILLVASCAGKVSANDNNNNNNNISKVSASTAHDSVPEKGHETPSPERAEGDVLRRQGERE